MKIFYFIIILILLNNCSFDNKTGIWKDENSTSSKENDLFKEFKNVSKSGQTFNEVIELNKNFNFRLHPPQISTKWLDQYYKENNNFDNFKYDNKQQLVLKSKKLTRYKINDFILFNKDQLVINDEKGNIIFYSTVKNKVDFKFNFYKKGYKKIKKNLNVLLNNNILYVSDNIGFLYAVDIEKQKIIWAKNYKIPFRSNLKIYKNKLIAVDQNNQLYFLNIDDGEVLKLIPTEETAIKNNFKNVLSMDKETLYFLNTFGSLYSINLNKLNIEWFVNLNATNKFEPSNLFNGREIILNSEFVVSSTNNGTYVIDANNGSIVKKNIFETSIKSLIISDYLFLVTNENFIISYNLKNNKILYSYNVDEKISEFLKIRKKKTKIKYLMILNNNIYLFLKNSYVLNFDIYGNLNEIFKLPAKIKSNPIIVNEKILFVGSRNKLYILN